jgi:truncated hemoglobin YjbI
MFLDNLGGKHVLEKIHKIFYDKMYAHPWMGKFFVGIKQEIIESQQTDFMVQNFGGPANYVGKIVVPAHKHMFITDEMFNVRQKLLEESLIEAGVAPEHRATWLKIDGAFRAGIVKNKVEDCQKRFFTDEILIIENPEKKRAA